MNGNIWCCFCDPFITECVTSEGESSVKVVQVSQPRNENEWKNESSLLGVAASLLPSVPRNRT